VFCIGSAVVLYVVPSLLANKDIHKLRGVRYSDMFCWLTGCVCQVSITLAALLGFVILFLVLGCQQRRQEVVDDYEDDAIDDQAGYDEFDDTDPHID